MGMGVKTVVGRVEGIERMKRPLARMLVSFRGVEEGLGGAYATTGRLTRHT